MKNIKIILKYCDQLGNEHEATADSRAAAFDNIYILYNNKCILKNIIIK